MAYIDPGTGSLLIQGLIGAIAAIGFTMKMYWHKIKLMRMGRKGFDFDATDAAEEKVNDY